MKRFKTRVYKSYWQLYLIIVVIETFYLINILGNRLTPKIINIVKNNVTYYDNLLVEEYLDTKVLSSNLIDEVIELIKNKNEEIVGIDYKIGSSYKISQSISSSLNLAKEKKDYTSYNTYAKNKNGVMILSYPVGLASDNIFLQNLGYKIPVRLELNSNVLTGLKTKVTNYGINNALVELYLKVSFTSNIVYFSLDEKIDSNYEILLAAKMVMGNVPSYLNGYIEQENVLGN
ncbi:MAG: sporulation protein YunB [bacterium]|nr:sporulation protein YunB [bacterium]